MKNIQWFFPEDQAELTSLLFDGAAIIHSGGTGLIGKHFPDGTRIIDLSHLGLDRFHYENGHIELGAMLTYAKTVKKLKNHSPDSIVLKSLQHSANTPLRNRITLGGSIAFFPLWSDLMGPLLALDAQISLIGAQSGDYPLTDYVNSRILRKNTVITALKFDENGWYSDHYREIRTSSDMPLFTITLLLKKAEGIISDSRIFVVGTKDKYIRLENIEIFLNGKPTNSIDEDAIASLVNVSYSGSRINDHQYAAEKTAILTGRIISKLVKEL